MQACVCLETAAAAVNVPASWPFRLLQPHSCRNTHSQEEQRAEKDVLLDCIQQEEAERGGQNGGEWHSKMDLHGHV